MNPAAAERPVWVLRLRPLPRVDGERAVQRLLKFALRTCGLKCIGLAREEHEDDSASVDAVVHR